MTKKYSKSNVLSLLEKLDQKLEERVEIVAIGGTALSLSGEREYSKDIDICYIDYSSPPDFARAIVEAGKEVGIASKDIEMFHGFEMSLLDIPRFSERAITYTPSSFKNIILKIMHPADIILSKIYRGELKDIDDVKKLLDDKIITVQELQRRFIDVVRNQKDFGVRKEFVHKYELFIKTYQKEK